MSSVIERLNAALGGRYRIEEELGAGGMATVYLAEDLKHRRRVALKVLQDTNFDVFPGDSLFAILVSAGEEPTTNPTVTVALNFDQVLRDLGSGGRQ